jgi:UDP-4-amino-4,6-dideoxy-N-acetyl-beta-L-altrosamine transaminase
MSPKVIPYGCQQITERDIEAVVATLRSDFLTQGPQVAAFEEAFASYIGSRYAIAVANGTAALHLSALALGVGPGKRVITSPLTFAASANCVLYCGGTVEFCDIDRQTLLLDIEQVRKKLEAAHVGTYAGIIPVDFAGATIDMEAFRALADDFGLFLLEDSCHAPGGYFTDSKGKKQNCGNGVFADAAIFSFHPVKHITCGEGGMITTNDPKLYQKLLRLRTHGITKNPKELTANEGGWYYEMQDLGFNYRLSDISAALGLSQLERAVENLSIRRSIADKYAAAFESIEEVEFMNTPNEGHAYHLAVIQVKNRKELYEHLRAHQIYAQVHYIPLHLHPYYQQRFGTQRGDFPEVENYYAQALSLPIFPTLDFKDLDYIITTIKNFYSE